MGTHKFPTSTVDAVCIRQLTPQILFNPQCNFNSDPKTVSDEEYELLYQATFKDFRKPLAWSHFTGDSGSGVSFRAIVYIPSHM